MSEESDSSALKRDQTTQDFLTGLKERKDLENKLQEKERECNTLKGVIYDMTKKVEDLEKQVSIYPLILATVFYLVFSLTSLLHNLCNKVSKVTSC